MLHRQISDLAKPKQPEVRERHRYLELAVWFLVQIARLPADRLPQSPRPGAGWFQNQPVVPSYDARIARDRSSQVTVSPTSPVAF
jgi:hypothetical protein